MSRSVGSLLNRVAYFSMKDYNAVKSLTNRLISTPEDSIILPFTDYPGPITDEILSREFASFTVCERHQETKKKFQSYVEQNHPDRNIHVYSDDLFDLSFKAHNDEAQRRCRDIVGESLRHSLNETRCDKPVKFLVPLLKSKYESGFLRNIYYQMCLKIGLCSDTLVHYYFLTSDRQYNYLIAKPKVDLRYYRSHTVLYNTIFNIHRLESYDLNNCFRIPIRDIQKTAQTKNSSYKEVHLLWLEPRLDVLGDQDSRFLLGFRFLVNQIMYRRRALILPIVQQWFGDCTDDVFRLGITDSTRAGDLEVEQYYMLHRYLINRPDYRNSTFLEAAASVEDNLNIES